MPRYVIATCLLILYMAGSVWLVRREGIAYRAALEEERLARRFAPPPLVEAPRTEIVAVDPTTPAAPPAPMSPRPDAPEPVADTFAPDFKPVNRPNPIEPPPPAPGDTAAHLDPAAGTIWDGPEMRRVWDLSDLSPEDETRLGQALHDLVLSFHRKVEEGSMPRRVEEAAEPFVAARTRREIDYTFTVLDSDAINAFSHPGGYVYVTSGLIGWIGEDQSYALEFVLAHEIAHVDLRHAQTCLADPGVKNLGIGTIPGFFLLIFPRGYYPDRLDFEADGWAYRQMRQRDRTKRETLAFLRKLEGLARDQGFETGRMRPRLADESSPVENHLRAHPAAYKRLKQLENLTKAAPARAR